MCDLILSFYLGLVGLLLIAILIYIYVELVESYDDLNLIVEKIKYKGEKNERVRMGEIMERPNKYDFDFSEDYESNLETYCDELEKALDKAIKKITLDNDEGFEHLDSQYEYWKDWLMKDE